MSNDDDTLTDEQLERLRELLEQKLEEVRTALVGAQEDARPVGLDLPIGRLTRVDALQQQHMAAARKQRLRTQETQIQQALARVGAGTYGECVRCEEPVGYRRLSVQPEAPLCLRCQQEVARSGDGLS